MGLRAVVGAPIVVGAATRGQQLRVVEFAAEHLAGRRRIHNLDVNALLVHVHDAAFGTEAELAGALESLHRLAHGVEEAGRRHRVFAFFAGEGFAFDQEGAAARFGRDTHFRRRGFVALVDVTLEYIVRFHQVSIYIGDFESIFHGNAPNTT